MVKLTQHNTSKFCDSWPLNLFGSGGFHGENLNEMDKMKDKQMTTEQAYREYHTSQEAFQAKDSRITMKRDSWDGGRSVTYYHRACNTVTMIVSGDVISYTGKWC